MFSRNLKSIVLPLARFKTQFCSQKPINPITKVVDPYSNVRIRSDLPVNVIPFDVIDCQDGNLLRFSWRPIAQATKDVLKKIEQLEAKIEIDDKTVSINTVIRDTLLYGSVECFVEVPIRSNLRVLSNFNVSIRNLYSENISADSSGEITTNNLQAIDLDLRSSGGDVICRGMTLANYLNLRTYGDNAIHVHKAQGDTMHAVSENGLISIESCYSKNSKFVSSGGDMKLQNVHSECEIRSCDDGGSINVTGFHGVLKAETNGGNIQYQLTEIHGDSFIEAINPREFVVNISELVEEYVSLSTQVDEVVLLPSLGHLNAAHRSKGIFEHGKSEFVEDKLSIKSNGKLQLGKMSWMESMQLKLAGNNKEDTTTPRNGN